MKIFHLSDTHIGSEKFFEEQNLLDCIELINEGDYDLVVLSGDLTHDGMRHQFEKAKYIIDSIKPPLVIIPGNHDARSGGIQLFRDYIGPSEGYTELGDAVIIFVSSTIDDSNAGRLGRVQFEKLKRMLYRFSSKAIKILVIHHHILPVPKSGRERNVLMNAGDVLDLIVKSDVDLVLLGHRHYPNIFNMEDTVFLNAGTISSAKTRYGDVNSYNTIEINDVEKKLRIHRLNGKTIQNRFPRRHRRIFTNYGKRQYRIVHMANTFITDSRIFLPEHFDNALKSIEELAPDLVIHCGGIVGEGVQGDYDLAFKRLSKISANTLFTPSGRDINYFGYGLFPRYFGPMDQQYFEDNIMVQGISSFQYDSSLGMVGETTRLELEKQLLESNAKLKALFLHHNVVPVPRSRNKALLEDSGDFLRCVVDAELDLVLTGTSSHPHACKIGNTVIANANSLSSIYQRSPFGNSFNLIDVYEKMIAVSEISSLWGKRRLLGLWERNTVSS